MARGKKKEKKELTPEERLQNALVPEEEWPYELPEGWKWVKADGIIDILRGVSYKKGDAHSIPEKNDVLVLRGGNIGEGYIDVNQDNVYVDRQLINEEQLIQKDDVVIVASTGSTKVIGRAGISAINYPDVVFGAFLMLLRPTQTVNGKYVDYFFQSSLYRNAIRQLATGVNINNIRSSYITDMLIPLPTLSIQERIVDFLEKEFNRLDEAKDQIQSVLDSSEERKHSILHKAFTGELTEKWRRAHNHSINEWKTITLDECGEWYGGGTPSKSHPEYWDNANLLWITSKDMKTDLIEDTQIKINQSGVDGSSAKLIENPAILFVMRSGILRHTAPIAMVKTRFTVNQDLKALVIRKDILLEYVFYACREKEHEILNTCMKNGTTVESLEFDKLKKLQIRVPSTEEQKEIVRLLNSFIAKEDEVEDASDQIMSELEDNKKSILSKAFRGELKL